MQEAGQQAIDLGFRQLAACVVQAFQNHAARAEPDRGAQGFASDGFKPEIGQRMIGRRNEVGCAVDERAIEIEDEGGVFHLPRLGLSSGSSKAMPQRVKLPAVCVRLTLALAANDWQTGVHQKDAGCR